MTKIGAKKSLIKCKNPRCFIAVSTNGYYCCNACQTSANDPNWDNGAGYVRGVPHGAFCDARVTVPLGY